MFLRKLKIHAFIIIVATSGSGFAQKSQIAGPSIEWEFKSHDFGDIVEGEKVEFVYKFTNSGTEPLIITNVQVTCGCTTPKGWSRDPIKPGGKGELPVVFNSSGKFGRQNKVVTIVSNAAEGNSQVTFSANVLEKKIN